VSQLGDDPEVLFATPRRTVFLTLDAAVRACELATERGNVVYRVEGGIWHPGQGCEMRLDAIWDGEIAPANDQALNSNNARAAIMIATENEGCDTFVLSMKPTTRH